MKRVTIRAFRALARGSPDESSEPLEVTSHGFLVGIWYPSRTADVVMLEPRNAAPLGDIERGGPRGVRPAPKPGKR